MGRFRRRPPRPAPFRRHADELAQGLDTLGYEKFHGAYRHPERNVIFVGDEWEPYWDTWKFDHEADPITENEFRELVAAIEALEQRSFLGA